MMMDNYVLEEFYIASDIFNFRIKNADKFRKYNSRWKTNYKTT